MNSTRRLTGISLLSTLLVLGPAIAWIRSTTARPSVPANALVVLQPYRHAGTWVFDDPKAGLRQEPFVAGVPEMIDALVRDIPDAANGFRLLVSASPFPGAQRHLDWIRGDLGGNYYRLSEPAMEGWLCPALFRYYPEPPKQIHLRVEPLTARRS